MMNDDQDDGPRGGGSNALARNDHFEGTSSLATRETASTAMAAAVQAQIQARWVLAVKRPRVLDQVRVDLLKECKRPGFAERAWFKKPQGKKLNEDTGKWEQNFAEGLSIRFAEAAVQRMGNLSTSSQVIFDDEAKRIVLCQAIDYETNASWDTQVVIPKTVERKSLRKNQRSLGTRVNSYGEVVHKVEATEDEVEQATARRVSMAIRNLALRLVPSDVLDDCKRQIHATIQADVKADPDAARKRLVDSFAEIGVKVTDLVEYLGGRQLDALSPTELVEMRAIFAAIRDGDVRWPEVLESSPYRGEAPGADGKPDPEAEATRERLKAKAEKLKADAAAARAKGRGAAQGGPKAGPAPGPAAGDPPAEGSPPPSGAQAAPPPGSDPGRRAPDPGAGEVPPDQEPREPGSDG